MGIISQEKYKVINKIGEGGFGEVYLIEKDNKHYALKRVKEKLKKEQIEQYNEIINILSKIDSKYIIKYYELFQENDSLNIMMDYAGEKNLKDFIENYKNENELIPENIIINIIKQICKGLYDIHKNNLIHRDLTPDNIFIDENTNIKIGDFGISKILSISNKYFKTVIGKFHYLAPEIERGLKYNNKVDIYSLGCIIYELFTLNEYYLDKKIEEKDCKINLDLYNSKWQVIIDLLTNKDYHQRPDIEEIIYLIQGSLFTNEETFTFNDYNLIKDEYYNSIKENIICCSCGNILIKPIECLKCHNLYCLNCIGKTEIHKCQNVKYSISKDKNALIEKLQFSCNICFKEINYEGIENHIRDEHKKAMLKRLTEDEYNILNKEKNSIESKKIFLNKIIFSSYNGNGLYCYRSNKFD